MARYFPNKTGIKVIYQSKDGKEEKAFDALEWLAAMCSHVPNKGEQVVRYYGHYSNVSRGKRKRNDQDKRIPSILEPDGSSSEYRKNWTRLIQKIYEVDRLTCPKYPRRISRLAMRGCICQTFENTLSRNAILGKLALTLT